MDCPKCGGGMVAVSCGTDIEVMRCNICAGLFCEAGVLEKMRVEWLADTVLDTGSAATGRIQDEIKDIQCPGCGTTMAHVQDKEQPHITLEVCPSCQGTFLDAGELTDMKNVTLMDHLRRLLGLFNQP